MVGDFVQNDSAELQQWVKNNEYLLNKSSKKARKPKAASVCESDEMNALKGNKKEKKSQNNNSPK